MKSIYSIEASTWTSELVRTRDEKINQRKRLNWIPHENFSPFFLQCFFIGERPHGITSRWSGNFPLPPLHAGELHDVLLLCTKTFKIAFFFPNRKGSQLLFLQISFRNRRSGIKNNTGFHYNWLVDAKKNAHYNYLA